MVPINVLRRKREGSPEQGKCGMLRSERSLLSCGKRTTRSCGVCKFWKAAKRVGIDVGRDQRPRLLKTLDIEGGGRIKRVKTTEPDPDAVRHRDLVNRVFAPDGPNRL